MQPQAFGGAGRFADSVYDRSAPGQNAAGEAYVSGSGYSSNEERLLDQAMASQLVMSPDQIRAIRPTTASGPLFPDRFTGRPREELNLTDIVQVDRRYPDSSAAFSGRSGSYSGSMSPSLGWW